MAETPGHPEAFSARRIVVMAAVLVVIGFAVVTLAATLVWRTQEDHPDHDLDAMRRTDT